MPGESDFSGSDYSGGISEGGLGSSLGDYSGGYGMDGFGSDFGSDMGGLGSLGDLGIGFGGFDGMSLGNGGFGSDLADVSSGFGMDGFGSSFGQEAEDGTIGKAMKGFQGFMGTPFGKALGMAIGRANPTVGSALGLAGMFGKAGTGGRGAGNAFGGMVGGIAGSALGGPLGGMLGSSLGSSFGGNAMSGVNGYSGPAQGAGESGSSNMDGLLGAGLGLGGMLYQNSQNNKGLDSQISGLQGMYGQDSPYAQVLRQTLDRRDAAAGRRSQYGPREVELQAALAGLASRNAPTLAGLNSQKMQQRQQLMNSLGFGLQQLGGVGGIRNLFSGNGGSQGFSLDNLFGGDVAGISTGGGLSGFSEPDYGSFFGE